MVDLAGPLENPQASSWQVVVKLKQNVFSWLSGRASSASSGGLAA
jgi:hypothetical protein